MWADLPIFGDLNKRQDVRFDPQDLINLFLIKDPEGKKQFAYLSVPGLRQDKVVRGGTSISRALYVFEEVMYGVFGSAVYSFDSLLSATLIGTIGTNVGPVSITANNGGQIIFVDSQSGYIYTIADGSFTKITAEGFPLHPLNVAFLDGYFVIPSGESRQFGISALNNGFLWDALDIAQIQAYPGVNVGVGVVNRRLYFFKTDSTEVWYNVGASDFPFRRDNNLLFNFGCLTAASIVSDFGFLCWLARDKSGVGSVMMTTGQVPEKISDESIDDIIASFEAPEDMSAYIYKENGHIFYVMNWTTDDMTLFYDITMQKWGRMEMQQFLPVIGQPYSAKTRHLGNCHAYFNGQHYLGNYKNPTIYSFSRAYPDNDGEPMRHIRTCRSFFDKSYKTIQANYVQLDLEMGLGDPVGVNQDPKVYLSISRDGGHTYGNEIGATLGRIGERRARAFWRKKGLSREFVFRFAIYNNVSPIAILGASIDYEVLTK